MGAAARQCFFASLTGGLPRLTTDLERGADGILRLTNLQFYSPKLRLSGEGMRRRDGSLLIEASGRQAQYGALRLRLDGRIERPEVELTLAAPNEALGVRDMRLFLAPIAAGYDYRANGQSRLGPFTSTGQILLPKGGRATIDIAALNVAGSVARGDAAQRSRRLYGQLRSAAAGLSGTLGFRPVGGDQQIEAHLTATTSASPARRRSRCATGGSTGRSCSRRARRASTARSARAACESGGVSLARLTANARLVNGAGQVRAALAGRRGQAFEFMTWPMSRRSGSA